ncbi:hypothetical protein FACS1894187_19640 [Synergistales bacterium]|nr:hypothetical protein FACS1894187_19640 [Synergistales bacterium]
MALCPIIRPAFPEVVPIDNLHLNVHSASICEFSGNVENGELSFRISPMKIAGDEFQIDNTVIALKEKSRVDKRDQEQFAPPSGKKVPRKAVA